MKERRRLIGPTVPIWTLAHIEFVHVGAQLLDNELDHVGAVATGRVRQQILSGPRHESALVKTLKHLQNCTVLNAMRVVQRCVIKVWAIILRAPVNALENLTRQRQLALFGQAVDELERIPGDIVSLQNLAKCDLASDESAMNLETFFAIEGAEATRAFVDKLTERALFQRHCQSRIQIDSNCHESEMGVWRAATSSDNQILIYDAQQVCLFPPSPSTMYNLPCLFLITLAAAAAAATAMIQPPAFPIDRYSTFWSTVDLADNICTQMYYWAAPSDDQAALQTGAEACIFLLKVSRGLDSRFADSLRWYYMQRPVTCIVYSSPVQLAKISAAMITAPADGVVLPVHVAQLDQPWIDNACATKTQAPTPIPYDPAALRFEFVGTPFHCKFHTDVVVVDFQPINARQTYVMNTLDAMKFSVGSVVFNGSRPLKDSLDTLACTRVALLIGVGGGGGEAATDFLQQLLEQNSIRVIRESEAFPYNHLARIVANELKHAP